MQCLSSIGFYSDSCTASYSSGTDAVQGAWSLYIRPRTPHCVCTEKFSNKLLFKYLVVSSFFANFEPK